MIWEAVTLCILSGMLIVHLLFRRIYSQRIKQFNADISEIGPIDDVKDEDLYDAIMIRIKISAKTRVDRTTNNHVILIHSICIVGLLLVIALSQIDNTVTLEWLSLLLLLVPILLLLSHMYNIFTTYIKRDRLSNVLSKLQ